MAEMKKVPAIRFKGFNEIWSEKNLSEIATMKARIGWQGLTKKEYLDSGNFYLITGTDFFDGRIDFKNCHYVNEDRYAQDINIQIKNDDVLITKDGTIGKVAYVDNLDKPTTLNAGVFVIRGKDKSISNLYLYQYLAAPYLLDYAYKQATGGTIKHLNQNVLVKFPVPISNVNEQTQIGSYFQHLDNLISLHQAKVNKLTNLKKAMLEKMFPKPGADVPEIRFKGFAGAWEEKKLGEVAEFNPKSDLPDLFEYVDLESVIGTEMVSHREETKTTAPSRAQRLARKGDLFYQTVRPYQKNNHLFDLDEQNFVFSTGYAQLRPYGDGYFLLSLVQTDLLVKSVLDNCTGTSYPAINSNALAEIKVSFPLKDEQTKIGAYFQSLDKTITLHQSELEKLGNLKKACLEKMFV